jgi:hypothetical protein
MLSPVQLSLEDLPSTEAFDKARGDIQGRLAESGSRLAQLNWRVMRNAVGGSLRGALGKLDLLDYMAGAWCTATELQELARQTLDKPGSEEPFSLDEHEPSALLHPVIKIKCGPVELPALTFDLKLGAKVTCAVLVIANGKLTAIETGTFKPYAELSYGDHELNTIDGEEVSITRRFPLPNGGLAIPCSAATGEGDWTKL